MVPSNFGVKRGYLYINPEDDILWITSATLLIRELTLVSLLHDLLAYDPRGVGVKHLGVSHSPSTGLRRLLKLVPKTLPLPLQHSMKTILSESLTKLHFVAPLEAGAPITVHHVQSTNTLVRVHTPMPILPSTPSYRCYKTDPRDIKDYLKAVIFDIDMRRAVYMFNQFKANFGVARDIPFQHLVGISIEQKITSVDHFASVMKHADRDYSYRLGEIKDRELPFIKVTKTMPESEPLVAGVWCLPGEAFGKVPGPKVDWNIYDPEVCSWREVDLSKHTPELWAFYLE